MIKAYDSHCHVSSIVADDEDSSRLRLVVAINDQEWDYLYRIRLAHPHCKISFGIHPWEVDNYSVNIVNILEQNIIKYSPDCIGEIGLDKLRPNFAKQLKLFELQLQLAKKYNLSVIVHCVKAYNEIISLFKKYKISAGIVHAYNANSLTSKHLINLGLYLGIGGFITKPTTMSKNILDIDVEYIVLESDAPYMSGLDNNISRSSDCDKYAQNLATYYKVSVADIIQISNNNFLNLFRK